MSACSVKQGTWQFMSVAMLSQRAKTVEVPDDMESFFYVILYYAARYLASNIIDVPAFIENFFDSYGWIGGAYTVGETKYNAIDGTSHIRISPTDKTVLCFSSPLDQVLSTLRKGFHSLYLVRAYESQEPQALLPLPVLPSEQNNIPCTPSKRAAPIDSTDVEDCTIPANMETDDDIAPAPTDDDRERAAFVSKQILFLSLLKKHMNASWPRIVNKGDLIPLNWKSTRGLGPSVTPSNRLPSKRQRLSSDSVAGEPHQEALVAEAEAHVENPEDQLLDQTANHPTEQPTEQPVEDPVGHSAAQPEKQPEEQPEEQPMERPVGKKSRAQVLRAQTEGVRRSARLANKV